MQAASQSTKKPKADTFDSKGDDISSISSYQQTIEDLKQQLRERDAELRLHSAHGRLSRKGSSHSTSSEPSMQGGVAGTIDSARRSITGEKKLTKKPSAKQAPRTLAKLENVIHYCHSHILPSKSYMVLMCYMSNSNHLLMVVMVMQLNHPLHRVLRNN